MKLSSLLFLLIVTSIRICYSQEFVIENKFSAYKLTPPVFLKGPESFDKYINTNIRHRLFASNERMFYTSYFILKKDNSLQLDENWARKQGKLDVDITNVILVAARFWKVAKLNGEPIDSKIKVFANGKDGIWEGYYEWVVTPEIADTYYNQGVISLEANDYMEAIKYFNESLYLFSTDIDALYNRGVCKFKINDRDGACEDWKMINRLGKTDADNLLSKYCN